MTKLFWLAVKPVCTVSVLVGVLFLAGWMGSAPYTQTALAQALAVPTAMPKASTTRTASDSFSQGSEGLSANWSGDLNAFQVTNGRLVATQPATGLVYKNLSGTRLFTSFKIMALPNKGDGIFISLKRWQDPTSNTKGYFEIAWLNGYGGQVYFFHDNQYSPYGNTIPLAFAVGDTFAAEVTEKGLVTVYKNGKVVQKILVSQPAGQWDVGRAGQVGISLAQGAAIDNFFARASGAADTSNN